MYILNACTCTMHMLYIYMYMLYMYTSMYMYIGTACVGGLTLYVQLCIILTMFIVVANHIRSTGLCTKCTCRHVQ